MLFLKNSIDINICAFMSKLESMNNEKKEQLREKILLFLNFQYITVKKSQILTSQKVLQNFLWIRTNSNALIIDKYDFNPAVEIANIYIRKILWND